MSDTALTEPEIRHLRNKYETFTQGNGLSAETLKEIYKLAQVEVTDAEIKAQILAADSKGNGKIDFEDFLTVMSKQHDINAEEGVTKIFEILDADKDGQINGEDLKRGAQLFGKSLTDADIEEMLASADVDGDGLINYEEFLKVMTPNKVNGQPNF